MRRTLDLEDRIEARQRAREKQAQLEREYRESLKSGSGRLTGEWRTVNEGTPLERHERTGRLALGGLPVVDGDRLAIYKHKNQRTEVTVRYSYSGQLREIAGAWGDTEDGESYQLVEGMRARRIDAPEKPQPAGWHTKYIDGKWAVVKGDLVSGAFDDMREAAELCEVLSMFERSKAKDAARDTANIQYRRV